MTVWATSDDQILWYVWKGKSHNPNFWLAPCIYPLHKHTRTNLVLLRPSRWLILSRHSRPESSLCVKLLYFGSPLKEQEESQPEMGSMLALILVLERPMIWWNSLLPTEWINMHIRWSGGVPLAAQVVEHLSGRTLLYYFNKQNIKTTDFSSCQFINCFLFVGIFSVSATESSLLIIFIAYIQSSDLSPSLFCAMLLYIHGIKMWQKWLNGPTVGWYSHCIKLAMCSVKWQEKNILTFITAESDIC